VHDDAIEVLAERPLEFRPRREERNESTARLQGGHDQRRHLAPQVFIVSHRGRQKRIEKYSVQTGRLHPMYVIEEVRLHDLERAGQAWVPILEQVDDPFVFLDDDVPSHPGILRDPQRREAEAQTDLQEIRPEIAQQVAGGKHQVAFPGLHGLSIIEQQGNFAALFDELDRGIGIGLVVDVHLHLASIDSMQVTAMDSSRTALRKPCSRYREHPSFNRAIASLP
jgi:hypothetical protein